MPPPIPAPPTTPSPPEPVATATTTSTRMTSTTANLPTVSGLPTSGTVTTGAVTAGAVTAGAVTSERVTVMLLVCSLFLIKRSRKRTARTPDRIPPPTPATAWVAGGERALVGRGVGGGVGRPGRRAGAGAQSRHVARCRQLSYPGDVYSLLIALSVLAGRLPQALAQAETFLVAQLAAGRVVTVDGAHVGDPDAAVAEAEACLHTARAAAHRLHVDLDHVAAALVWAAGVDP